MEKVKNILYVDGTLGFGGSISSLVYLLRNLDRSRYKPHVIACTDCELWRTVGSDVPVAIVPFRHITDNRGVKSAVAFTGRVFGVIARKGISLVLYVIDVALFVVPYSIRLFFSSRALGIDLVHLNNRIYRNAGGILLAKYIGVPCVVHYRGFEYHNHITRFLARHVDRYIAISECTKRDLLSLGVPESKIAVIPEGIDLKEYSPARDISAVRKEFSVPESGCAVGIVGCLVGWKGHPVFLKAAKAVLEKHPDCRMFVVGGGDADYKKRLEKMARDEGIAEKVHFTGYRSDVPDIMRMMDVVVHASTEPEPFGRVIIEAMAMERPVIATRIGAPPEIIRDRETGYLVAPGNPRELAEVIIRSIENRSDAAKMGQAARRAVEEKFTIEKHARDVEAVYGGLLADKDKKGASRARPVKIAHVTYGLRTGGLEKMVINLISRLDRNRFEPIVCCISSHGELAGELERLGVKVYLLNRKDDATAPFLPISLSAIFIKEGVKIVHTHNYAGYLYGVMAAILARAPSVIHTQHGRSLNVTSRAYFMHRILDWKVNRIVAVADVLKEQLSRYAGISKDKMVTVPNGICDDFPGSPCDGKKTRKEFGFKETDKIIGTVARLDPVKNLPALVRGFAKLHSEIRDAKLVIVGDGPDGKLLKEISRELNVEKDVFFMGLRNDIPKILPMFDLFVLTSEWESMSLALVEAMAASLPIVATSVGGNPELVRNMENGILVPPADNDTLAGAMARILTDKALGSRMGSTGRRFFENRYTLDKMTNAYEEIYADYVPASPGRERS